MHRTSWNEAGDELVERETQLMVTAFMTRYVWGENVASDLHPNIRKPKNTRYDDLMNALEYVVIGEGVITPPTKGMIGNAQWQVDHAEIERQIEEQRRQQGWMSPEERQLLRIAQIDDHPEDREDVAASGGYLLRSPSALGANFRRAR